jgi:hypothetical protein
MTEPNWTQLLALFQVYDQVVATPTLAKIVLAITIELRSIVGNMVTEIEPLALSILGDLKALTLLYSPSINGKGSLKNPLPAPALSTPQLFTMLRCLYSYFQSIASAKVKNAKLGKRESLWHSSI